MGSPGKICDMIGKGKNMGDNVMKHSHSGRPTGIYLRVVNKTKVENLVNREKWI